MLILRLLCFVLFLATIATGIYFLGPDQQATLLNWSFKAGFDVKNIYHLLVVICLLLLGYAFIKKWLSRALLLILIVAIIAMEGTYLSAEMFDINIKEELKLLLEKL